MSELLTIVNRLLDLYRTPDSGVGSLIIIGIDFSVAFLIVRILLALYEKLVVRKPLRWSSTMFSFLFAVAFYGSFSIMIFAQLEAIAASAGGKSHVMEPIFRAVPLALIGNLLIAPFSVFLGIPALIFYVWRPETPRFILIAVALITVSANYAFDPDRQMSSENDRQEMEFARR